MAAARARLFELACDDAPVISDDVRDAIDEYTHELAEKIRNVGAWDAYPHLTYKTQAVYRAWGRRFARLIDAGER